MSEIHVTPREAEIIHWMAEGKTASEIGIILGISEHTVNTLAASSRSKFDAVNSIQMVAKAIRGKVIE